MTFLIREYFKIPAKTTPKPPQSRLESDSDDIPYLSSTDTANPPQSLTLLLLVVVMQSDFQPVHPSKGGHPKGQVVENSIAHRECLVRASRIASEHAFEKVDFHCVNKESSTKKNPSSLCSHV